MIGRVGVAAAIVLTLGACMSEKRRVALGGWTQERMLADGWIKAPHQHSARIYCYRTLADPDCHTKPVRGQSLRLTVPVPAKDE
jgi:hypothetical protein